MAALMFVTPTPASADTVRGLEWHIGALRISQAQQISRGDGVIVAVLDTGTDRTTPTLRGHLLQGTEFGVPASPDGLTDSDTTKGHGTAMAGIIAGQGGGQNDMLGIAPGAKILPVAVKSDDDIANGLRWSVDHGAKVVNLSVAAPETPPPALVDAVRYAQQHDAVVVAGAGNVEQTGQAVGSPANIPGVVAVSATDKSASFWSGSSRGPQVAIAAPGYRIIAPVPRAASDNGYLVSDGTSNSTAIVSGVAALIRSKYPSLNAPSVINRLIKTAKDQGDPGRDQYFGYGTVNVIGALTAPVPEVSSNPLGAPASASGQPSAQPSSSDSHTSSEGLGISINPIGLAIFGAVLFLIVLVVVIVLVASARGRQGRNSS
ncbi:S8 family serine peptidase [Fodinicola acaciae]|uniref:S8 family serine peptidase n=1 Tax=Fodinicola acaciae TaxID=2681555 RepID=UPI001FE61327|nr:S8 family serine peptidase [Fodinicola acaciae]